MNLSTNKYGNVPTVVDGIRFASKREAQRYRELKLMERAGVIGELKTQVEFPLKVNGHTVSSYVADFTYTQEGKSVVEDVKGYRNRLYLLKRKLMKAIYNVEILET